MKPRTKKGWKRYCRALWSKAVRLGDDYTCQYCGKKYDEKSRGLHAHHLFTFGCHPATRYDMDNGIALCFAHHEYAKNKPHDFKDWLIEREGYDWWLELRHRSNMVRKTDYELTAKILEDVIRELEGGKMR